jgi:hypothetical protein
MKRYRIAASLLLCAFGVPHALATNVPKQSTEVNNDNVNWNWNHNANRNYNRSSNEVNNKNSNQQGQHQSQSQSQTMRNSGNSSSRSNGVGIGVGGSLKNAGNNTGNSSAALSSSNSANGNQTTTTVQGDNTTYQAAPRPPVSSAIAPSLVSGADTCMGSTSLGAQGVGLGVSVGKTFTDDNCVMLKNSTMLWNMGKADAAIALLCTNPQIRKAMEQSGTECPDGRRPAAASSIVPAQAVAPMPAPDMSPTYEPIEPMISARNRKDKG